MPLPIVQKVIEPSISQKTTGCRVFVSYSHKDMDDAKQFIKFFTLKLRGTPELGITQEHVFFDRDKLLAGEEWDESIQRALDEAQYFILLVSADSLSSKYCFSRELATAVARDLPILQIIVNHCPWEEQPVPGDQKKRRLGGFGALPKDDQFAFRPIAAWPEKERADAWNKVVQQLIDRMLKDQTQLRTSQHFGKVTQSTQPPLLVTPLLPYFCNQIHAETQFNGRVQLWNRHVLLVMTRGLHDDNVPRFWDRIRSKNLKDFLTVRNGQLLETKSLIWPLRADLRLNDNEMASAMMGALSQSLTDSAFKLRDCLSLSQRLSELTGVLPLITSLPKESRKLLSAGVRTLLNLFEQCPAEAPLDRLVIALFIEDESLLGLKDLCKALKLTGYQRTHFIDLMPLKEIEETDILHWHRAYEIEKLCGVPEERLVQSIYGNNPAHPLRLRKFAEKVELFL